MLSAFAFEDEHARNAMIADVGTLLSDMTEYGASVEERWQSRREAMAFVEETVRTFDVRGYRLVLLAWIQQGNRQPLPFEAARLPLFCPDTCARHASKVSHEAVEEVVDLFVTKWPDFGSRFVEAIDPFLDDEGMEVLCLRVLPLFVSHGSADASRWQRKALHCACPRLLQFVRNAAMYDPERNAAGYKTRDLLFRARSELAVKLLIEEGFGVNEPIAGPESIVPLHSAATLQCVRALLAAGADPSFAIAKRVPLPRACVLGWICDCVPSFELPVERILRQGRTFDYVKLLVEERKVEIPRELIPSLSPETKWCLFAMGVRVDLPSDASPVLSWLRWRPRVHRYFPMHVRKRVCVTLMVFRRLAGFVPRDIRFKILAMAMN